MANVEDARSFLRTKVISDLLSAADDELAPWIEQAITNCTLSSTAVGMLQDRPLEELARE